MRHVQAVLIGCEDEWETEFKILNISFVSLNGIDTILNLQRGRFEAAVAFVHLGYQNIKSGKSTNTFLQNVVHNLPETTRRIFYCGGMESPISAKNVAISYEGDLLIDGQRLHADAWDAYTEGKENPIKKLIQKGYVTQAEISERGKTIELENGQREGVSVPPERKADDRYHPFDDREYIARATKGEKEK